MNDEAVIALSQAISGLLVRQEVMTRAVSLLIQQLPPESKPAYAALLRAQGAKYVQDLADTANAPLDEAATIQLAMFLEAAGEPPQT